jgi:hypothetical protein
LGAGNHFPRPATRGTATASPLPLPLRGSAPCPGSTLGGRGFLGFLGNYASFLSDILARLQWSPLLSQLRDGELRDLKRRGSESRAMLAEVTPDGRILGLQGWVSAGAGIAPPCARVVAFGRRQRVRCGHWGAWGGFRTCLCFPRTAAQGRQEEERRRKVSQEGQRPSKQIWGQGQKEGRSVPVFKEGETGGAVLISDLCWWWLVRLRILEFVLLSPLICDLIYLTDRRYILKSGK